MFYLSYTSPTGGTRLKWIPGKNAVDLPSWKLATGTKFCRRWTCTNCWWAATVRWPSLGRRDTPCKCWLWPLIIQMILKFGWNLKKKSLKHEQKVPAPRSTSVHVFQSTMSTSPSSVPAMNSSGREAAIISPNRPSEKINLKQNLIEINWINFK